MDIDHMCDRWCGSFVEEPLPFSQISPPSCGVDLSLGNFVLRPLSFSVFVREVH
jgi:hypothetical protein